MYKTISRGFLRPLGLMVATRANVTAGGFQPDLYDLPWDAEQMRKLQWYFNWADRNHDNILDIAEFNTFTKHYIGRRLDQVDRDQLFEKLDTDRDGHLSMPDVLKHIIRRFDQVMKPEAAYAFCQYDKDDDGRLRLHEVREALYFLGQLGGAKQVTQFFEEMDTDRDNKIDLEQFTFIAQKKMPKLN